MEASNLDATVDELHHLDLDALRKRWRMQFGRSAPKNLPKRILYRLFVYRIQAETYGDLRGERVQFLNTVARDKAVPLADVSQSNYGGLKPGIVLVREHAGARHRVAVTDGGFIWNGTSYPSLSQVAKAITGTAWNGPRFFGLREQQND
ncbi:MAG TPA: DUF2924 domain-containing protein [Rhizomicrobium sp.]|nr:DUF2924 domain-containing protein [Rhizomicrobium sp.]